MEGGSEEHEGLEELAGLNSGKGMTSEEEQPQQINTNTNVNTSLVKEKDNLMPPSNVTRIMRKVLPLQAKISDDAKVTILDIISEYISFITHEASVQCHSENRKIITGEDIIWAMKKLGFNNYVEPLFAHLRRYKKIDGGSTSGNVLPLKRNYLNVNTNGMIEHPALPPLSILTNGAAGYYFSAYGLQGIDFGSTFSQSPPPPPPPPPPPRSNGEI
ncbi:hypothetical protein J5N97_005227 [Dioscorea zingiberensis]|uniref:Transcription factor CBF/NF-Y/archaeal histone domain-containing protein n=1 Tax=Dioscorea zingiberensis TaxID=325984 RepID=A0A9D5D7Q3_9LILI|nr:hypothetical protein J5N97_005227 [Dioscorea zingiberensis]